MVAARNAARAAAFCAVLGIAVQVAGKAARDAIFLATHDVHYLPPLLIATALLSFVGALGMARLMTRFSPGRVVPLLNVGSAVFLVVWWLLAGVAPGVIAVVVYLHLGTLGGLLVSGFWSLVNERFDPRAARKHMGTIGAGAAAGGLLGGLLVERLGSVVPSVAMVLPVLAALQLILAWRLHALARTAEPVRAEEPRDALRAAVGTLRASAQLRRLTLLVVLGAAAAAILDYVFKAGAVAVHAQGQPLLRFFALYYVATGVGTVILQFTLGKLAAVKLGPALSMGTLPAAVVLFGSGAAIFPGLLVRTLARGAEAVLRNSLYRSGYELLFAPMPDHEKRATKSLIDVGAERVGDAAGGLLVSALLAVKLGSDLLFLLGAMALGLAALFVTWRMRRGQTAALARSLRTRAEGKVNVSVVYSGGSLAAMMAARPRPDAPKAPEAAAPARAPADPLALAIAALRSGDAAKVTRALRAESPLPLPLVAHVIPLLGWDEVAPAAATALQDQVGRIAGQLLDRLLDPDEEFAVRRRLPGLLEQTPSALVTGGLCAALADPRFEVRYRCGRALQRLRRTHKDLTLDTTVLLAAVRREVSVERGVWESPQRTLESGEPDDSGAERTSRSLEHVFRLLSLAQNDESLALAYRGIGAGDAHLRGTALEYLENVLPADIRTALWPFLEDETTAKPAPTSTRGAR